jgi:hypothetical protein
MEDSKITVMGPNVDPDSLVRYFLEDGPLPKGARIIDNDELIKLNKSDNEFIECIHHSDRPSKPPSRINVIFHKLFHGRRNKN